MSDPIESYFAQLARAAPNPLHHHVTSRIRFELDGGGSVDVWHLTVAEGRVSVRRESREADTVIRIDRDCFARMARGDLKPLAAWLRNEFEVEGHFYAVVLLERLFPAPAGARHPRSLNVRRVAPA